MFYSSRKTNALSNLSFFSVFLAFLVAHFQFYQFALVQSTEFLSFSGSLKCASHGNLEFFSVHSNVLRPEILSFSGSLKLRFSFTRKTQKGRPLGQKFSRGTTKLNLRDKNNIVPSLGTPKFVCFLSKKKRKN